MKKMVSLALCLMILLGTLGGCSSGDSLTFSFDLYSAPSNFDPLFANTSDEQLIIDNTMMGLLMFDEHGQIVHGDAQDYSVSSDGKTYTFQLREDAYWSDGTPVTAQDYVFAFRRMFDPTHPADAAKEYTMIAGAAQMMAGHGNNLGVVATGDKTLTITLTEATEHFPELLCGSAAVPCNEAFFNSTGGRYGLEKKMCLFNGPFIISNIYDDVIYLARNDDFWGADTVGLSYVSLNIQDPDETDPANRYGGGATDAAYLTSHQLELLGTGDSTVFSSENCTYALIFSPTGNASDTTVQKVLAMTADVGSYLNSETANLTAAHGLIPSSITIGGESYRETAGAVTIGRDTGHARDLLRRYLDSRNLDHLPTITILCPNNDAILEALQDQVQIWQRDLQVYLNISVVAQADMDRAVAEGNYDIALMPFTASYNDALSLLNRFSSAYGYFADPTYDSLLQQAGATASAGQKTQLVQRAEELLIQSAGCIPLFCERNFLLCDDDFDGLYTSPSFSRIFFGKVH